MQVVHNDIKSKNILLTKDAVVAKISDVGTSRILETTATTLSFPMLFTYAYAAPEQLMGLRDACTNKVHIHHCCHHNKTYEQSECGCTVVCDLQLSSHSLPPPCSVAPHCPKVLPALVILPDPTDLPCCCCHAQQV